MIETIQSLISIYNSKNLPEREMRVVIEQNDFAVEIWDIEKETLILEESFFSLHNLLEWYLNLEPNSSEQHRTSQDKRER